MSLPSDVTVNNLKDFYAMILPYLNVGNGGTSDTPLGQVAFFDDVVAPAGWLIADGSTYNIADYPDLATQYERVHGSKNFYGGNGTTTFAVPDLQGEFLRASGTNSHANQGSGAAVGVHQDGTISNSVASSDTNLRVPISDLTYTTANPDTHSSLNVVYAGKTGRTSQDDPRDYSYTSRPTNTSLLCCVKAVPSSEMNVYSLTEKPAGTWIDGKPLYQKTVLCSYASSITEGTDASQATAHNISNIDSFVYIEINNDSNQSTWGDENATRFVSAWFNATNIYLRSNRSNKAGTTVYVTVRYTKTTDV